MSPKITVTNAIEFTEGLITEERIKFATFDSLMFSAKTQAQLDSILAAVPVTTPIAIDSTGLTEKVVISDGYPNVYVKTATGVTIKRTASGFMLIVK